MTFVPVDTKRKEQVSLGPNYFVGESTFLIRDAAEVLTVPAGSLDEAVELFQSGKAEGIALGRQSLERLALELPGTRILPGSFHSTGTAIAVHKNKPTALVYVSGFIEQAKADGTIRGIFDRHGLTDCAVAPAEASP